MGSERLVRAAPPLALLIALAAVGPSSLHVLIPLLPTLARDFATDTPSAQLALTSYLVAMACAQLVYGPLSDRWGRRPVLLGALVAFLAGTALCGLSPSIGWMILGRFVQGFGGCAGIVLGRAMIRDMHGRDKSASVIGLVTMGMAVIPAFSPAVGAYVDAWLGWRTNFALLAAIGAAMLGFSWLYLAETHFALARGGLRPLALGHLDLLRQPAFLVYTAVTSSSMASWYAFTAGAPYILVHFLDLPPTAYGEYILIPMAGYIAGNYVAARFSVRLGVDRMMFVGVWTSVGAGLLFLLWTTQGVTPLSIFVPMAISVFGNGISQPNATAGGISVNPRLAGTASGVMGFLQTVVAAAATVLVGFIQPTGPLAMVGVIVGANLLGLVAALATKIQPREAQRQGG